MPAGKTGWTTSEVLTVSEACAAVATSKRSIVSTSSTADTYIGDIVFFKNKADAEEYAKLAPIYLDPNGDVTIRRMQKKEENWETIKLIMMLIGSAISERIAAKPYVPPLPLEGIDEDKYFIFDCSKGILVDFLANNNPAGEHVTYNGVGAVKLGAQQVWTAYAKSNATFARDNFINGYGYMVMRYASESDQAYQLGIGWSSFYEGASFTVVPGKTDWTLSKILTVSEALVTETAVNRAIASTSATADTYIADIVFFEDKEDAKQYIEQWNTYYEDRLNPDVPTDPVYNYDPDSFQQYRITADNYGTGVGQHSDHWTGPAFKYTPTYGIVNGYEGALANTYQFSVGDYTKHPVPGTTWNGNARSATRVVLGTNADPSTQVAKYMVVNYYSYCNIDHQLGMAIIDTNKTGCKTSVELAKVPAEQTGWHTTEPLDLVATEEAAFEGLDVTPDFINNIISREIFLFSTGYHTAVTSNSSFKIASIVFFANEADAKAYAEEAPDYYNNLEADDLVTEIDRASKGDVYSTTFEELGLNWEVQGDWANFDDGTPTYGDVVYKGVSCMKIEPGKRETWSNEGSTCYISYRDATRNHLDIFTGTDKYKYVVLTYATETKSAAYLKIHTWGSPAIAVCAQDISISDGKWVTSGIMEIESTWTETVGAKKLHIYSNLKTPGDKIYIRSINYFTNEDDAKAYIKAAPEYYNGEPNYDPDYWQSVLGEGEMLTMAFTEGNYSISGNPDDTSKHTAKTYEGVECVEVGYGAKKWPGNTNYRFGYTASSAIKTEIGATEYNYAVATYASKSKTSSSLHIYHFGTVDDGCSVLAENISNSKGKWVTSDIVEVDEGWRNRLSTAGNPTNIVYTDGTAENEELYLREIRFFTNEDDAKLYQSLAPEYYNSFNGN